MAMIVRNNTVANRTLSNLDKTGKARAKSATKLSSGMKINSAADDASSSPTTTPSLTASRNLLTPLPSIPRQPF